MNAAFINPFITATMELFKTMLPGNATQGTPTLKKEPFPTYDVSGIIGLSGDAVGAIAMSFPLQTALNMVGGLLGCEYKEVNAEVTDGIGEIANIIAGNAKQHLVNCNVMISLPNVVVGKDHALSVQKDIPTILVPFDSNYGDFVIEVSIKSK